MQRLMPVIIMCAALSICLFLGCSSNNGKSEEAAKPKTSTAQINALPIETSKKDTDNNQNAQNRPTKSSITNSKFSEKELFGAWTTDPNGPHADFELNKDFYFVVDYDGDGNMPYTIKNDSIRVFLKDLITTGHILKAQNDTLKISWDNQEPTAYFRWKQ